MHAKLAAKIMRGEMYELLSELCAKSKEGEKLASCARAKKRILGLNFAVDVEVVAPKSWELMDYLIG